MLLILGALLVFSALGVAALALRGEHSGVERSLSYLESMGSSAPSELTEEMDRPFGERVLDPLQRRALTVGRRITGADAAERIRRKLELAGNPPGWTVDRVVALKVLGAVAGGVLGLGVALLLGLSLSVLLVAVVGATVLGFFGPDLWIYQVTYDRDKRTQQELADAIDLMAISVEAGLGFDAAVQQVATKTEGPLADEFARLLREMQLGKGRSESLRALAERSNVADVRSFVSAMVQAESFGIPIAQVLRVQTEEMRTRRRQRAEEKAQQVPVKITVPLIFCILPALFVAVMGPAAISILETF